MEQVKHTYCYVVIVDMCGKRLKLKIIHGKLNRPLGYVLSKDQSSRGLRFYDSRRDAKTITETT